MTSIIGAILAGALLIPSAAIAADGKVDAVAVNIRPSEREVGVPTTETFAIGSATTKIALSHPNVVPNSDWAYIGLIRAKRGLDYVIDYSTGAVTLPKPLPDKTSMKIGYSYVRRVGSVAPFGSQSGLHPSLTLQPMLLSKPTGPLPGPNSVTTMTYGVDSLVTLGASSAVSGIWFASAPQDSRDSRSQSAVRALQATPDKAEKSDKLIVQTAGVGLGSFRLRMGYQSVGANFKGFDAMRSQGVGQGTDIAALEKEKGIKRMDMTADLATSAQTGVNIAMSRILDHNGEISSHILGFSGNGFAVSYGSREVGKSFKRFGDLREADNTQMAAEAGMRRSVIGVRFAGLGPGWNTFGMSQLSGDGGNVTTMNVGLDLGRLRLSADTRSTSSRFARMGALDEGERSGMALATRRVFNPTAKPQDVTNADKLQFNGEAGLNRANYFANWNSGSVAASIGTSRVNSINGGVGRTTLSIEGKGLGIRWSRQQVDEGFDRLGSLQPVERAAFGNERGMSRTNLTGQATFGATQVQMGRSDVNDHGATAVRQTIAVKSPKLSLQIGYRDISPNFTRVMDLADTDRQDLVRDIGFQHSDYTLSLRPNKWLAIDSFADLAGNATDGRTRDSRRHEISYTPDHGPQVKILSDSKSQILADGKLTGGSEESIEIKHKVNVAGGCRLVVSSDAHTTVDSDVGVTSSKVYKAHIESEQQGRSSFSLDTLSARYEDGQSENVQTIGLRSALLKNMSVYSIIESVTTGKTAGSGLFGSLGLDWAINSQLKVSMNLENVGRGANAGRKTRQFSLNGVLAKRFLMLDNIRIGSGVNTTSARGEQTGCDNAFKMEAGLLGGKLLFSNGDKMNAGARSHNITRLFSYISDPDPAKTFHISYSNRHEVTPRGELVNSRDFAADARLWRDGILAFRSNTGAKNIAGCMSPLTSTSVKLSQIMPYQITFGAEYAAAVDGIARTRSRSLALSLAGKLSKSEYELKLGRALVDEGGRADEGMVFRVRFDQKLDENRFISFSAGKSLIGAKSTTTPDQNDTTARLDLRTMF